MMGKIKREREGGELNFRFKMFTFASFWQLCPHLLHPLKNHVAMPEEFWTFYNFFCGFDL